MNLPSSSVVSRPPALHPAAIPAAPAGSLRQREPRAAFTLIELLTVIAIIAILMGLLLPAIGSVREHARRVQAKSDVTQIITAIKSYYTEYGKYPTLVAITGSTPPTGDQSAGSGSTTTTNNANNSDLFDTLRAITGSGSAPNAGDLANPRKIVFFEAKNVSDSKNPKSGFGTVTASNSVIGALYDPWGAQYVIFTDSDYDNIITLGSPPLHSDFIGSGNTPRTGAGAFSLGKDGKLGTSVSGTGDGKYKNGTVASDDVISWQ